MDIGFALNYQHVVEVDVTPNGDKRTWAWVGPGISDISKDNDESTSEDAYYNNGGNAKTDVTGVAKKYSVEGHRLIGDPFQDYVASIEDGIGSERETSYRITDPTGKCIEAPCTVLDIAAEGPNGAANEKTSFSCTLARSGTPVVVTDAAGTLLPESVTVTQEVTVAANKSAAAIKASVLPEGASKRLLFAIEDTSIARVSMDGVVTGLKAGETRLAVKCASKPSVSTVVKVTVSAS